jgi:hypothetical protein
VLSEVLSEVLKFERNQKKAGKVESRREKTPSQGEWAGAPLRIPRPTSLSTALAIERGCSYVETKRRSGL